MNEWPTLLECPGMNERSQKSGGGFTAECRLSDSVRWCQIHVPEMIIIIIVIMIVLLIMLLCMLANEAI